MKGSRMVGWAALALVGAGVLAAPRVAFPADTGTWAPLALPGASVAALVATDRGVLAAHGDVLALVGPGGSTTPVEVDVPVRSLVVHDGETYAGTTDGILVLSLDGGPAGRSGLDGLTVHTLAGGAGGLYGGTDRGLHRRGPDGTWTHLWPAGEARDSPVTGLVTVGDTVVFLHAGRIHRWHEDAGTEVVHHAAQHDAVSLSRGDRPGLVWAGLRGGALLLASEDSGRTWAARGRGLGFSTVNDVTSAAGSTDRLLAAGSGLADGSGNAGVQESTDGGRTWSSEQDRLSNTHVFAVESRREPVSVDVSLPAAVATWRLALPVWRERSYAATNGGGVYSISPSTAMARNLASLHPALRAAEPVLLGLLVLVALVPAFGRLTRASTIDRGTEPRSPIDPSGPTRRRHR